MTKYNKILEKYFLQGRKTIQEIVPAAVVVVEGLAWAFKGAVAYVTIEYGMAGIGLATDTDILLPNKAHAPGKDWRSDAEREAAMQKASKKTWDRFDTSQPEKETSWWNTHFPFGPLEIDNSTLYNVMKEHLWLQWYESKLENGHDAAIGYKDHGHLGAKKPFGYRPGFWAVNMKGLLYTIARRSAMGKHAQKMPAQNEFLNFMNRKYPNGWADVYKNGFRAVDKTTQQGEDAIDYITDRYPDLKFSKIDTNNLPYVAPADTEGGIISQWEWASDIPWARDDQVEYTKLLLKKDPNNETVNQWHAEFVKTKDSDWYKNPVVGYRTGILGEVPIYRNNKSPFRDLSRDSSRMPSSIMAGLAMKKDSGFWGASEFKWKEYADRRRVDEGSSKKGDKKNNIQLPGKISSLICADDGEQCNNPLNSILGTGIISQMRLILEYVESNSQYNKDYDRILKWMRRQIEEGVEKIEKGDLSKEWIENYVKNNKNNIINSINRGAREINRPVSEALIMVEDTNRIGNNALRIKKVFQKRLNTEEDIPNLATIQSNLKKYFEDSATKTFADSDAADGKYGRETYNAIIKFQKDAVKKGFMAAEKRDSESSIDGLYGPLTHAAYVASFEIGALYGTKEPAGGDVGGRISQLVAFSKKEGTNDLQKTWAQGVITTLKGAPGAPAEAPGSKAGTASRTPGSVAAADDEIAAATSDKIDEGEEKYLFACSHDRTKAGQPGEWAVIVSKVPLNNEECAKDELKKFKAKMTRAAASRGTAVVDYSMWTIGSKSDHKAWFGHTTAVLKLAVQQHQGMPEKIFNNINWDLNPAECKDTESDQEPGAAKKDDRGVLPSHVPAGELKRLKVDATSGDATTRRSSLYTLGKLYINSKIARGQIDKEKKMTWYRWLRIQVEAENIELNSNTGTVYTKEDPKPITRAYLNNQKMARQASSRIKIKGSLFKPAQGALKVKNRDFFVVKYTSTSSGQGGVQEFFLPTEVPKKEDVELRAWGSEKTTAAIIPIYDSSGVGIGWVSPGRYLHFHSVNGNLPKTIELEDAPVSEIVDNKLKLIQSEGHGAPVLERYTKKYEKKARKCV
jgi:hypothetical protein